MTECNQEAKLSSLKGMHGLRLVRRQYLAAFQAEHQSFLFLSQILKVATRW